MSNSLQLHELQHTRLKIRAIIQALLLLLVLLSCIKLFAIPWIDSSTPGYPVLQYLPSLLKFTSIDSVMPSNHLVLCCPLLLLPSIFPSIRFFSNELALHIRWLKYWNFSFSISPSNAYSGLISFRMDWLDLLTVQGTLKSLLQYQLKFFSN